MYEHILSRGLRIITTCSLLLVPIFLPIWYFDIIATDIKFAALLVGIAALILATTITFAVTSATPKIWQGLRSAVIRWTGVTTVSVVALVAVETWRKGTLFSSSNDLSTILAVLVLVVGFMTTFFYRYLRWSPGKPIPKALVQ